MCFLFGPGIPILFPIGLVCLCINYFVDRHSIARLNRRPSNLREEILQVNLNDLLYSPIFYTGFGFWMYGNRQIFENYVKPIDSLYNPVRYDHKILNSLTYIHVGTPFLILFIISVLMKIIQA